MTNIYKSGHLYVIAVIRYSKENIYRAINQIVGEKGAIDNDSFQWLLKNFSFASKNNIFYHFTKDDIQWLLCYFWNISSDSEDHQSEDRLKEWNKNAWIEGSYRIRNTIVTKLLIDSRRRYI